MMRSKHFGKALGVTLLIWGLCSPVFHAEAPVNAGSGPALLQDLSFTSDANQTKIVIQANRAFDYTSYYPNPRLFIVDVPGAQSQLERNFVDLKTAQVDFASFSQIGEGSRPIIRIEFNLTRAIQYSLRSEGNRLFLTLKSMNPDLSAVPLQATKPPALSAKPVEMMTKSVARPSELALREDDRHIELVLPTANKPSFKHFELAAPNRVVIDVDDSVYRVTKQAVKINSDLIRRIRFGYGDSEMGKLVRCVFDLSRQTPYTVVASDAGVVIRFEKQTAVATNTSEAANTESRKVESRPSDSPKIDLPAPVAAVPESPATVAVSSIAGELRPLNGFLMSQAEKFVMPVPLAAPRDLSLLEGRLSLVTIEPKDKQADTQLLTGELKMIEPPLPEPSPAATIQEAPQEPKVAAAESSQPLAVTSPESQTVVQESVAPNVEPERPTEIAVFAKTAQPEPVAQVAALVQNPGASLVTGQSGPSAEPLQAAPVAPSAPPVPATKPSPTSATLSQVISAAPVVQAVRFTGELISLELKDADIKDFFRLIGEISGLNIVLDPDVKGSLTIFLNDVPWDQALDVVLKNNSLGKQLDGNVLRIASNATLEAEEAQRKRLSDARVLAAELQTETRILSYAKAAELSTVLKKVLSPRGDIIVDTRTNAMIISDIPGKFPAIDALIKQLDRKIKQVEIEARVIAATRDFLRDIGVQIGAIYGNYQKNTVAGAVPGNPFTRTPPPSVTIQPGQSGGAPNSLPLISNLAANAPTSGLSFFAGITDRFLLDTIITAAERRGSAKLLSKPKIITQDNIQGFVQQGVKIPVQTTINNTVSVQFFDFSLKLTVTPQITDEGTIILQVDVENSTPDFSRQVQSIPTVNTQQTKTTVLVNNGGTVVVGGVLIDNEQVNIRQVPGIGSLPVIGNLFKNRSVNKQTQELIFFISPKIL
jgi:type IV pilus secretin PilQ/predicted competence protein